MLVWGACLAMANKAKAGCFARLSEGKVLRGLLRRRKVEFALFYVL